jgi:hypothetical protein
VNAAWAFQILVSRDGTASTAKGTFVGSGRDQLRSLCLRPIGGPGAEKRIPSSWCWKRRYQDRRVRSLAGVESDVLGLPDRGGVRVARINRDLTTRGDCLGSRPVERIAEHTVWACDPTPKDATATLIVIVAEQTGLSIEKQARCGDKDIADVCLRVSPRRAVIR